MDDFQGDVLIKEYGKFKVTDHEIIFTPPSGVDKLADGTYIVHVTFVEPTAGEIIAERINNGDKLTAEEIDQIMADHEPKSRRFERPVSHESILEEPTLFDEEDNYVEFDDSGRRVLASKDTQLRKFLSQEGV